MAGGLWSKRIRLPGPQNTCAVQRVQSHLAADGFPCPRPLLEPTPLGQGYATVEELVDEGDAADAHRPVIRQAMATTLARLVISARSLRDIAGLRPGSLTLLSPGSPWPVPHSPIFDFDATAVGAEWIDQVATEARETLARSAGDMVIGHGDWSAQNVRFVGEHLRVVYDWDSLTRDQETTIVAQAATTFPDELAPARSARGSEPDGGTRLRRRV